MKDLVCVFTYCPDQKRKEVLFELLKKLQEIRDKNDILILSHSPIPEMCYTLCDYVFVENENHLIESFEHRNKFWFNTEILSIESSLVYPPSTHYAIYSLIHSGLSFANSRGYIKMHCIEYDINLDDITLIEHVSVKLNDYDNVMFMADNGWVFGTYFAFKTNNFPNDYYKHNKKNIIDSICVTTNRMTESYTPKFLSVNNRKTYFESLEKLDKFEIYQKIDNHNNMELNWCVPVYSERDDIVYFFMFNEKGGEWDVDILFNNNHKSISIYEKSRWLLEPLCKLKELKKITILLNKKVKYSISFDENNINQFVEHNKIYYK